MSGLVDWINKNKIALVLWGVVAAALVGITFAGGCDYAQHIPVNVPPKVQQATKSPPQVPLSEANALWSKWEAHVRADQNRRQADHEEWVAQVEAESRLFTENIGRAWDVYAFIGSLVDVGLGAAEQGAATIPGGAMVMTVLAGLAGLFMRKPGTQRELDESYDLGAREALEKAKSGAELAGRSPSASS